MSSLPILSYAEARKIARREEREVVFIVRGTLHRVRRVAPSVEQRSPTRQSGKDKPR